MGMLIDGEWKKDGWKTDEEGHFQRSTTSFRDWVKQDSDARFRPESGRYHLYVSYACPWAHRTLITRQLTGLDEHISLSIVDPFMGEDGWAFSEEPGCIPDPIFGADYLREVYLEADSNYTGRVTVPVLWDKQTSTIVNNESQEIMRMFNTAFSDLADGDIDLAPEDKWAEIEEVIEAIYNPINNGVYRAGFAATQKAYDEAVDQLFEALDYWENILSEQRYLVGEQFTEADICMFTTLFRFDPVYNTHFKCNIRRIIDYPNLWNYVKEIYQLPGVASTCNLSHIKQHYYRSHESVNPKRIVPAGPDINYDEPHDRHRLPGLW